MMKIDENTLPALIEPLSPREQQTFMEELWTLFCQRAASLTMGESTSLPEETAQELLRGILFCIKLCKPAGEVLGTSPKALYEGGVEEAGRLLRRGRMLMHQAEARRVPVRNIAYCDTLLSLPDFFKRYDCTLFAHAIPCDIDYPLCHPVSEELEGVEYVNEYLRRLCTESEFILRFDQDEVKALLDRYSPDPIGLLINLYAPVAEYAFASDVREQLRGLEDEEALALLESQVQRVCRERNVTGVAAVEYHLLTARELWPRMKANQAALAL